MARPKMALGTWGNISVTPQIQDSGGRFSSAPEGHRKPARWRARAKVRDLDGKVRDIERFAATKTAAERELKLALAGRTQPASVGAALTGSTLVKVAADAWLSDVEASDRSINTRDCCKVG